MEYSQDNFFFGGVNATSNGIFEFLKTNSALTILNLNGTHFSDQEIKELSDALTQNHTLEELDLSIFFFFAVHNYNVFISLF